MSFIDAISRDPAERRMRKALTRCPFQNVAVHRGGAAKMFHFNCDISYVRPESLKKVKKYVKYLPLADLSASDHTYFTVACICDIKGDTLYLSDLHSCKRVMIANDHPYLCIFDVIAIANAELDDGKLKTSEGSQIVRIGHNNSVQKCNRYGEDKQCSGFVDARERPTCDFHCNKAYMEAGNSRALLKQNTNSMRGIPISSPGLEVFDRPPLQEIPKEFVNEYMETHAYGRGAKFAKTLDRMNSPVIGAGFSSGDIILL